MRALIVGSGGREHALAWKLAQECEVVCAPGNPGIAQECDLFPVLANDFEGLCSLAEKVEPDFVVIGPEDPLIAGLADRLRSQGHAVFGPGADGARHEASKAWSKQTMRQAGVPTAEFATFTDSGAALDYVRDRFDHGRQVAVKASGAALGKGVVVCADREAAEAAVRELMDTEAGSTVVIEDRLVGREFSLLTLVAGRSFLSLPVAQDYKRLLDGDLGPNTGGMGSVCPAEWVSADLVQKTEAKIVAPMLAEMALMGIDYRGVLFSGVMVVDGEPICLEYNVRFGDPETQSVVCRLGSGLAQCLLSAANGAPPSDLEVLDNAAVTVVAASGGYPASGSKGLPVHLGETPVGARVFHAGTTVEEVHLVTAGGRVLAVTGTASGVHAARTLAYAGMSQVCFEGLQFRTDIAS